MSPVRMCSSLTSQASLRHGVSGPCHRAEPLVVAAGVQVTQAADVPGCGPAVGEPGEQLLVEPGELRPLGWGQGLQSLLQHRLPGTERLCGGLAPARRQLHRHRAPVPARADATNKQGKTPLDVALERKGQDGADAVIPGTANLLRELLDVSQAALLR